MYQQKNTIVFCFIKKSYHTNQDYMDNLHTNRFINFISFQLKKKIKCLFCQPFFLSHCKKSTLRSWYHLVLGSSVNRQMLFLFTLYSICNFLPARPTNFFHRRIRFFRISGEKFKTNYQCFYPPFFAFKSYFLFKSE